jgi:hypothetical protein
MNIRKRWPAIAPYLQAQLIFLSSRLVMALAIIFAVRFVPQAPNEGIWNANPSWCHYLLRYDSGWFVRIMREGYTYDAASAAGQPVVFLPLYPLVSWFVGFILSIHNHNAVLIVSNLSALAAIPLLYKLIRDEYGHEVALYTVAVLSFFPTSLFFSAGYAESLTLLLIVSFFLFLRRGQFLLASTFAGLALATRLTSVVLLLPLVWEMWRSIGSDRKRWLTTALPSLIVATSGLWTYMIYLAVKFNQPLAFAHALGGWQGGTSIVENLPAALMLRPFRALRHIKQAGPYANYIDPWIFLAFLTLIIVFWKRLRTSHAIYAVAAVLFPYLTRSGGPLLWESFGRYMILVFPVFVVIGQIAKTRLWLGLGVIGVFSAMLFVYMAMFSQWYWAG